MALLGYAIHSKQLKNYLKSIAWIIGTPIALIVTYVIIAIVTHDPIVPRPLTVHQLLTGYNIVYTHDGKLYQNDEYVMDLVSIKAGSNFYWQVSNYWDLYVNNLSGWKSYLVDLNNKSLKNINATWLWSVEYDNDDFFDDHNIIPVLDSKNIYYIEWWLFIGDQMRTGRQRLIYEDNQSYLTQGNDKNYHIYSKFDSWSDTILWYETLKNALVSRIGSWGGTGGFNVHFVWILDALPVFRIQKWGTSFILQSDDILYTGDILWSSIYNNSLYLFKKIDSTWDRGSFGFHDQMVDVYKNWEKILSNIPLHYVNQIQIIEGDDICHFFRTDKWVTLCEMWNYYTLRDFFPKEEYSDIAILVRLQQSLWIHSLLWYTMIKYGTITDMSPQWINLFWPFKQNISMYNKIISSLIGEFWFRLIPIIDDFLNNSYWWKLLYWSDKLYRIRNHIFHTDTIFLRKFDGSGWISSDTISLIEWVDNFLGVYPTQVAENTDPNADINVGQLIMDTYFPKETEEVDPAAILIERLRQREERLNQLSGSEIEQ